MSDRLLTLTEMAARLKRSERQFRDDVVRQHIPFVKIGKRKRFDPSVVEKHLLSFEVSAAPELQSSSRLHLVTKYDSRLGW